MKHLALSLSGILTISLALCLPAQGQSAEDLLQQGSRLEQVEGNYEGAIALYRQIAENQSADRRLVARALLQMGKAYEVLGRDGAREAYTRIVNEYGDFDSIASEAAERVAAFRELDRPVRKEAQLPGSLDVVVLDAKAPRGGSPLYGAAMSPDGKYIVRWAETMVVQQIESGAVDTLSVVRELCRGGYTARFSPTGDRIALGCWGDSVSHTRIAVYHRDSRSLEIILDGGEYFDVGPGDQIELEIHDWSSEGSAVLASVQVYDPKRPDRHGDEILLVPVSGGTPVVIDSDYRMNGFWETQACLLQDGRFMFGEYSSDYGSGHAAIERFDVETGEHAIAVSDKSADVVLHDCLPESNTLVYSHSAGDIMTTDALFAATVDADGTVGQPRFLASIPEGAQPVPGARNGNVYYGEGGTGRLLLVADVDTLRGRAVSNVRRVKTWKNRTPSWSPDGTHLVAAQASGVIIADSDGETIAEWRSPQWLGRTIWSPDGSRIMSSFPPNTSRWQYPGTLVHDRNTGEISQKVPDLAAVAWLPDASGFYHAVREDTRRCLSTFTFDSNVNTEVFCLDADPKPDEQWNQFRWNSSPGWSLSPDGSTFAYWGREETERGQERPIYLLDTTTWQMEQVGSTSFFAPMISWSGDSKTMFMYSRGASGRAYSLTDQEWSDWSISGLEQMRLFFVEFNPSGTKVAVSGMGPPPPAVRLSVLHQPPGLLEDK